MRIVNPTPAAIAEATQILRDGGLVGMPTETVYGIAALASNPLAVAKTYEVKGRPSENPLIVHLASVEDLGLVARDVSPAAKKLADRFWPGPLTLVLPKRKEVLDAVTAGLDTVAVRVPKHHVALDLIRAAGEPVSAPSANSFMGLSPTEAGHIELNLAEKLGMILDGGPCQVGLESTVVDCCGDFPRILRPGGVSRLQIEAALGRPLVNPPQESERRSPGMYPKHYAPRTPLRIVQALGNADGGLTFGNAASTKQVRMPNDPTAYAFGLYSVLHRLDQLGLPEILVQAPPVDLAWEAVWDRLRKASGSA